MIGYEGGILERLSPSQACFNPKRERIRQFVGPQLNQTQLSFMFMAAGLRCFSVLPRVALRPCGLLSLDS